MKIVGHGLVADRAVDAAAELLGQVLMGEQLMVFVGPEAGIVAADDGSLSGAAEFVLGADGAAQQFLVCARTAAGDAVLSVLPASAVQTSANAGLGFRAAAPGRLILDGARGTELAHGNAAERAFARAEVAVVRRRVANLHKVLSTGNVVGTVENDR